MGRMKTLFKTNKKKCKKKSSKNTESDRHNHVDKKRTFRNFGRILEKESSRSGLNSGNFLDRGQLWVRTGNAFQSAECI